MVVLDCLYLVFFAFCLVCILSVLTFCHICILSNLHFVTDSDILTRNIGHNLKLEDPGNRPDRRSMYVSSFKYLFHSNMVDFHTVNF